ncbi:MAG: heavy metal translocating P-type ATPase [Betaproteobacteria bacterium]
MASTLAARQDFPQVPAPAAACFHCGLAVPAGGSLQVLVLGESRRMCCAGCEAVTRTIVASGFQSYYETRDQPKAGAPPRLADLPPSAIYDDPLAQHRFVARTAAHEREATLLLDGVRCPACIWLNERFLRRQPGVISVAINYSTRRMLVAWDERRLALSGIIEAIRSLGYDAFPFDPQKQRAREMEEQRASLWRLFVAGFGAMQVMMYAFPRYMDDAGTISAQDGQILRWAGLVLTAPVIAFACGPFFRSAFADLRAMRMGIDVPVSLGLLAGFAASAWATVAGSGEVYFDSVSMLAFLLLASRHFELSARRKAAAGLDRLARWMPSLALRLDSEGSGPGCRIAAHDLRPGDRVLVAPGELVPADGPVESGEGSTDESLLTGESRPVAKTAGSWLIGGSINVDQPLVMRVARAGMDTHAAAIARLMERAAAGRPRLVEAADRVARVLTWLVLGIALATLVGWAAVDVSRAAWTAIAVLMVGCPCALGLAAPFALASATGALARRGVVVRSAQAIEALAAITDVVVDKTGTLTEGRLRLARIDVLAGTDAATCLGIARALEAGSAHPVARALEEGGAREAACDAVPAVCNARHAAGSGIEALVDGTRMRIGTRRFVAGIAGRANWIEPDHAAESAVYLGAHNHWLARFALGDCLRPDAAGMVDALRARGLPIHLISGDDPRVVREVAARLGIDRFQGEISPSGKFDYVRHLQAQDRKVALIGDGLNDAPGLAQANVSIALGQGAPLSLRQADFVLMSGKLAGVPDAVRIAQAAMAAIRQNFGWSIAYNAVALPLAAFGFVGPLEAAVGMAASSFVVILNSARIEAAFR